MSIEKFTFHQDSKGTWWETCYSPPVKSVVVQARSKKQAFFLAYNDIKFDPVKSFGILSEKPEPTKVDAISFDSIRDFDTTEVLRTPGLDHCPCCGQSIGGK